MFINYFLWTLVGLFIGVVGFIIEANKKKSLFTNIVAAFFGSFITGFIIQFLIWPSDDGEANIVAFVFCMIVAFTCVKLEDNFFS
jgi:uncharacterized membrane protein YeaQ/YmgE (transglycosylase-associated protein family)